MGFAWKSIWLAKSSLRSDRTTPAQTREVQSRAALGRELSARRGKSLVPAAGEALVPIAREGRVGFASPRALTEGRPPLLSRTTELRGGMACRMGLEAECRDAPANPYRDRRHSKRPLRCGARRCVCAATRERRRSNTRRGLRDGGDLGSLAARHLGQAATEIVRHEGLRD